MKDESDVSGEERGKFYHRRTESDRPFNKVLTLADGDENGIGDRDCTKQGG
ncbi:MAG TPA: hypothetical protein V6D34_00280 [Candidatus Sericytochromatia bacterium]